ncbi:FHA domain-containing protein [Cardiosporidium cionae]|uniref:FHA domain-containing protein n=1 Tax=Cardiosporidium cionae TaxID=476202 RepID=A0ABQ7JEW4_9APIC|nr:FHA domain-containing protein [Cardiosporidium cionae]|eukprot:KAF8822545.1 FHA domain-containing protein [Cardiosporidium cionae]
MFLSRCDNESSFKRGRNHERSAILKRDSDVDSSTKYRDVECRRGRSPERDSHFRRISEGKRHTHSRKYDDSVNRRRSPRGEDCMIERTAHPNRDKPNTSEVGMKYEQTKVFSKDNGRFEGIKNMPPKSICLQSENIKREKLDDNKSAAAQMGSARSLKYDVKKEKKDLNETEIGKDSVAANQREEPNFEPSGILASESQLKGGILLKHTPPPDSRLPTKQWRLYMFKKGSTASQQPEAEPSKVYHLHRQPCYLFGKEIRVADILLMHPTISKQHAALQYRLRQGEVRPYIIDLESTNGTYLNGEKIEACRYYEMREQDTIRFGRSSRDFVLLHSGSVRIDEIGYEEYLNSRNN